METITEDIVTCSPSFDPLPVEEEATLKIDEPLSAGIDFNLKAFSPFDNKLKIEDSCKIELPDFPIDRPWLPQEALYILGKIARGPISEKELISLMDMVASEAISHFQLETGKFVAFTFSGRVAEISDTRIGLLRNIQERTFSEEIFVWRVGSDSFSGRT